MNQDRFKFRRNPRDSDTYDVVLSETGEVLGQVTKYVRGSWHVVGSRRMVGDTRRSVAAQLYRATL